MLGGALRHSGRLARSDSTKGNAVITASEIVGRIQGHVGCEWSEKTVDTFKAGDPEAPVSGVATTFLATLDVLRRAQARSLSFVIAHEPTFYHHLEDVSGLGDDPVLAAKRAFIEGNGLVVWRFHDHWHRRRPDGINEGMVAALGWGPYRREGDAPLFDLPETTVGELAADVTRKLGSKALRVVGDPAMPCSKAALAPGAPSAITQMRRLGRDDVEVLVTGEAREWETVEYARDAVALGKHKALILVGHAASEEAGMQHMAQWLAGFVDEAPIEFVPAGDPFCPLR